MWWLIGWGRKGGADDYGTLAWETKGKTVGPFIRKADGMGRIREEEETAGQERAMSSVSDMLSLKPQGQSAEVSVGRWFHRFDIQESSLEDPQANC